MTKKNENENENDNRRKKRKRKKRKRKRRTTSYPDNGCAGVYHNALRCIEKTVKMESVMAKL